MNSYGTGRKSAQAVLTEIVRPRSDDRDSSPAVVVSAPCSGYCGSHQGIALRIENTAAHGGATSEPNVNLAQRSAVHTKRANDVEARCAILPANVSGLG